MDTWKHDDSSSDTNLPTPPAEDDWSDDNLKTTSRSSPRRPPRVAQSIGSPLRSRPRSLMATPSPKKPRGQPRKDSVLSAASSSSSSAPKRNNAILQNTVKGSIRFVMDVLSNTFWMLRKPVSWLLAMYLVAVALAIAYQYATNAVFTALSPLCAIPGVSMMDLPFCEYAGGRFGSSNARKGDFPQLIEVQSNFGVVLENSVGGSTLALDLKNSEVAVRDLNALVRVSDLISRDELSKRLDDFTSSAKTTSRSLTKFGAGVNGVVDQLLAMDEYAIKSLERAQAARIDSSSQPSFLSTMLAPFRAHFNIAQAEHEIAATFMQASSVMDLVIKKLVLEAEEALRDLDNLENKLAIIYDIIKAEEVLTKDQENEVLAEIWTLLGGNRKKLSNFRFNRALLASIGGYREKALKYVSSSLLQLLQMQADLEELRDRVAQPALLADAGIPAEIPIEVHIQSIRKGVDRLQTGMDAAQKKEKEHLKKLMGAQDAATQLDW